jgi:hypothetical protein
MLVGVFVSHNAVQVAKLTCWALQAVLSGQNMQVLACLQQPLTALLPEDFSLCLSLHKEACRQ